MVSFICTRTKYLHYTVQLSMKTEQIKDENKKSLFHKLQVILLNQKFFRDLCGFR